MSESTEKPQICFLDECSIRLIPGKRRVLNTDIVTYNNGDGSGGNRRSRTVFGFMMPQGNDVIMVSERARSAEFISFLEYVREQNPVGKLWIVLDNARIHHARTVTERAAELEIEFVHLPPYSPDLNPIEFGWKDLKRELGSLLDFDQMIENAQEMAVQLLWHRKKSYSGYWDRRFTDGYLFGSKVG